MRRRELITLLGAGIIVRPHTAGAQQKAMPVIGFLGSDSPGPAASYLPAFHQGLSETGYVEGQNVAIEYRWAEGHYDRPPALAADLVGQGVDVIVTSGTPPALARKPQLRPSRSSSTSAIRSRSAWSLVSPGRLATSRASASCQPS